jgi:hemolysin III
LDSLRDPVSSSSHFFMALLAVVATLFLVRFTRGTPIRRLSVLVFGLSMVVLYSASGLYHALQLPPDRLRLYQKIDMSAIYLLIAGSCTPIVGLLLRGRFRVVLLVGEWALAAVGIAALWVLSKPAHVVMVTAYLTMGWLAMAGLWHYWKATGWAGVRWAMAGAAFYTLGAVVELANWPVIVPGVVRSHELLHFCDMAGTACHIVFVLKYVLPYRPPEPVAAVGEDGEAAGFAVPVEA